MKHLRPVEEKKPKGAPDWHDSDAPDANGRFRDLSIKDLAAWLIKTRKKDVKRISGSLTQQIVFNRNDDPKYAEKMEKTRKEVYKQLGRKDLLARMDEMLSEANTTGEDVWNHIVSITPEEDDIPWGFQDKIEGNNFKETKVDLKKLLKSDPDFAAYYKGGEERYDQDEVDEFDVYNELVVVDGELLDGYSRAARLLRNGEKKANAFVNEAYKHSRTHGFEDHRSSKEKDHKYGKVKIERNTTFIEFLDLIANSKFDAYYSQLIPKDQKWVEKEAEKQGYTEKELKRLAGMKEGKELIEDLYYQLMDKLYEAKPGPDAYMTGLSDKEKESKKAKMKKQAEMDDDDPDSYEEMPGDKEARESGKVKKSKHTTAYHKKFKKESMKNIKSFDSFISEKKNSDLWSPYQKADILAGDMFGAMGLYGLEDDELNQIIDLKKADKLAKKMFGEFGFKTLAAKEMEDLLDSNPKLLREAFIGPFVFNDRMSDEELLGMYNGALDGYSYYTKGMQYPKSDYKKAYQEIEKILKKRGVGVNEYVTEATRSTIHKAAKKGSYPVTIVVIKDGEVIAQELVKTPQSVPATFNVLQSYHKHKGATIRIESRTGETLFSESVVSEKAEMPKKYIGNDEIVYLKTKEDSRGAHYNLYYKGHDIDAGGRRFGSEKELEDFASNYILSNQLYRKLRYEDSIPLPESIDKYYLDNAKDSLEKENVYQHLGVEYGQTRRGDKYVQINYIPVSRPQSQQPEWVKVFYDNDKDLKKIGKELDMDLKESILSERFNEYSFKFGNKGQFGIDDVNVAYGFWGTLEIHYDEEQVSIAWEDAFDSLIDIYKFSEKGALYYLNSRAGRHLADKFAGGEFYNLEDTMEDYANRSQWKKWAKEYNQYAVEENVKEALLIEKIKVASIVDAAEMEMETPGINKTHLKQIIRRKKENRLYTIDSKAEKTLRKLLGKYKIEEAETLAELQKMSKKEWKKTKAFNKHITKAGDKYVMAYDDKIGTYLDPVEIVDEGLFNDEDTKSYNDALETAKKYGIPIAVAVATIAAMGLAGAIALFKKGARKVAQWVDRNADAIPESIKTIALEESSLLIEDEQTTNDQSPLGDEGMETGIKNKAKESGVPVGLLRIIMRRGLAAWKTGHRPGATQAQWGYARVNSFLTKQPGTWGKADSDIAKKVRDGGHDKNL
jgi:hypothetical protein